MSLKDPDTDSRRIWSNYPELTIPEFVQQYARRENAKYSGARGTRPWARDKSNVEDRTIPKMEASQWSQPETRTGLLAKTIEHGVQLTHLSFAFANALAESRTNFPGITSEQNA